MARAADWSEAETLAIVGRHTHREGPLLPILHEVQETFGYVPQAAMPVIARGAEPDAGRGLRRRHLLSRFPDRSGRAARGQAVPGRGLPVDGLRGAGGACRGAAGHAVREHERGWHHAGGGLLPRALRDRAPRRWWTGRWSGGSTRAKLDAVLDEVRRMTRVFVPRDAAAVACGADAVAAAITRRRAAGGARRSRSCATGRAGCCGSSRWSRSRTDGRRYGFGPLDAAGAEALVAAAGGGRGAAAVAHPQAVGAGRGDPVLRRGRPG